MSKKIMVEEPVACLLNLYEQDGKPFDWTKLVGTRNRPNRTAVKKQSWAILYVDENNPVDIYETLDELCKKYIKEKLIVKLVYVGYQRDVPIVFWVRPETDKEYQSRIDKKQKNKIKSEKARKTREANQEKIKRQKIEKLQVEIERLQSS